MSKVKGSSALSSLTEQITASMGEARPRERPMPAPTQLVHFSMDYKRTTEELERLKKSHAAGFVVALDILRSSPYQLMALDEERVSALMENLKGNPLNSPVVVRASSEEGGFELIAGHHRAEAYRRLGRTTIQAVLATIDDDQAERLVFYDNLLAPTLSDYERYLGFAQRRKSKNLSQEELASEAGVSQTQISSLLAFEKLPEAAQALIRAHPKKASALLFRTLGGLAAAQPERVVQAIQKVLEGTLAVTAAAAWVQAKESRSTKTEVQRVVIKKGNKTYAEIRRRAGQLVVSFTDEAAAEPIVEEIAQLLRARSE